MSERMQNVLVSTLILLFIAGAIFFGFKGVKEWLFLKENKPVVEEFDRSFKKLKELEKTAEEKDLNLENLFAAAHTKLSLVRNLLEKALDEKDYDILEAAKNNLQIANEILTKLKEKLSQIKNVRHTTDIFISISSSDIPANPTFPTPEGVSIIRAQRFHFRVRNGNGWFTLS